MKTCSIVYQEDQKKQQDTTLEETCNSVADAPKVKLSTKKLLKGHINKVNSVHYSGDSRLVLNIDLLIFIQEINRNISPILSDLNKYLFLDIA